MADPVLLPGSPPTRVTLLQNETMPHSPPTQKSPVSKPYTGPATPSALPTSSISRPSTAGSVRRPNTASTIGRSSVPLTLSPALNRSLSTSKRSQSNVARTIVSDSGSFVSASSTTPVLNESPRMQSTSLGSPFTANRRQSRADDTSNHRHSRLEDSPVTIYETPTSVRRSSIIDQRHSRTSGEFDHSQSHSFASSSNDGHQVEIKPSREPLLDSSFSDRGTTFKPNSLASVTPTRIPSMISEKPSPPKQSSPLHHSPRPKEARHSEIVPVKKYYKGEYLLDEKGRKIRNYTLHEGNNSFALRGHVITSKDSILPFIVSLAIVVVVPVAFLVFNAEWLTEHWGAGGKVLLVLYCYLVLMVWVNMGKTAWSDPGIIPRNLHIPDTELIACPPGSPEDMGNGMAERAKSRYVRVRNGVVVSKWCQTCGSYRPPRTSHCRLCDNCVEKTDHHCTWLNTCVGAKNYTSFFAFVIASTLCGFFIVGISIAHIVVASRERPNGSIFQGWQEIGALAVAIAALLVLLPLLGLLGYHIRLVWVGKTTIEMLRPPADQKDHGSLFAMSSAFGNFIAILCRPQSPSYVALHKSARNDTRADPDV